MTFFLEVLIHSSLYLMCRKRTPAGCGCQRGCYPSPGSSGGWGLPLVSIYEMIIRTKPLPQRNVATRNKAKERMTSSKCSGWSIGLMLCILDSTTKLPTNESIPMPSKIEPTITRFNIFLLIALPYVPQAYTCGLRLSNGR